MSTLASAEAWVAAVNAKIAVGLIPALLLTGIFLTIRLQAVQLRRLWHGALVTSGQLYGEEEEGDVSHFQALSAALSATVGVGNIAGVAMAVHLGGPGALFWMWVTGFFGMVLKFTECTLAVRYREIDPDPECTDRVRGGPMYYMTKGLGWRPLAVWFASAMLFSTFFSGSAIQANSLSDALGAAFGVPAWLSGGVSAGLVTWVVLGGVQRIGQIAAVLTPLMAFTYMAAAVTILVLHAEQVPAALGAIFAGAFAPVAGVTGVGTASALTCMQMGIRRGLFSSDAGTGSAPILHAAAQTEEPVSEGTVALLEPLIDTLLICSLTGLVLVVTGAWDARYPASLTPEQVSISSVADRVQVRDGRPVDGVLRGQGGTLERLFIDPEYSTPFDGEVRRSRDGRVDAYRSDGLAVIRFYTYAPEAGAPLTAQAFRTGLAPLTDRGDLVVTLCVVLFAMSTAISVSYYGDRCATFLIGPHAVRPYRAIFCLLYFLGALTSVRLVWQLVDLMFSLATLPNLFCLVLLSGKVREMTDSYFERRPWESTSEEA